MWRFNSKWVQQAITSLSKQIKSKNTIQIGLQ